MAKKSPPVFSWHSLLLMLGLCLALADLIIQKTAWLSWHSLNMLSLFFLLFILWRLMRQQLSKEAAQRAQLAGILEKMVDGVISIDAQGRIQNVNQAVSKIFGYSAEELLGAKVNCLMPEAEARAHDGYLQAYLRGGEGHIIGKGRRVQGRRKDGELFTLELAVSDTSTPKQRLFTGLVRDVSEPAELESHLRRTLELQQAILDSANFAVITTDMDGLILSFNHAAENLLQYRADEVIGRISPALFHAPEEITAYAQEHGYSGVHETGFGLLLAASEQAVEEREWTYVRRDGSRFPVCLSITALRLEDQSSFGYLCIATDLTERKKVDTMKREFISTVSHELRTPLTSIRGSLGLVVNGAAGALPDKAQALLEIANKNTERLVRLINDILDIEKIEAGKMDFVFKNLSLNEVIQAGLEANQGFAGQYRVNLHFQADEQDYRINGDQERLLQVLNNLLSNACKYSPQGGTVRVSVKPLDKQVRIEVRDEGEGIPENFRERLFDKFAQADSSDTRQKGGTGLGLSISKAIVEQHGGRIGVEEAQAEGGTCFYFELPRLADNSALESASVVLNPALDKERRRILICEDDPDIATLLRLFLEEGGFYADIAHTAADALHLLRHYRYAAMTLDLMLPDRDGLSFLHELRQDKVFAHLPIVVVSAQADQKRRELDVSALDVLDWIPKPIDNTHLIQALSQGLAPSGDARQGVSILHVEDDPDIRQLVKTLVEAPLNYIGAASLLEARQCLRQETVSLVLLDIGLPDGSGLDLLPLLHQYNIPVVIFSAQDVNLHIAQQVSATLTKAKTNNQRLLEELNTAINKQHRRLEH